MENKTLEYIKKIMNNVDSQKRRIGRNAHNDLLVCFRGESEDYKETKLMPSLFRNKAGILLEKELIELLSDYEIPESKDISKLSKSIAGQHFVQTSRLLDITFSILPALYFASSNTNEDGYVYSFVFPESFSPNSDYLNYYYDKLVEGHFIPYSKDFKVITHSYNNERLKMQSGGFILFAGKTFTKIPKEYYSAPTKILAEDKEMIRNELSKYFNMNEATLFPKKDKRKEPIINRLSNIKRNKFKPDDYIDMELAYSCRRIEFEINMKNSTTEVTPKQILRFLRKEKASLMDYIENNYDLDDEKKSKRKDIEQRFTIMEAGVKK